MKLTLAYPVESHKQFRDKYGFPFVLLSDEEGEVVRKYGAGSWIPGRSARAAGTSPS